LLYAGCCKRASSRLSGWGTFFSHAVHRRSGAHTLPTDNAVGTLDYGLAVDVIDLVGPRGSRRDLSQKISGTRSGAYAAKTPFERGHLYRERDIDRAVTILIEDGGPSPSTASPSRATGKPATSGRAKAFSHRIGHDRRPVESGQHPLS